MPKLTYRNDWESDVYQIDGKYVKDISEIEIDGEKYTVVGRQLTIPYNDMGHEYFATSTHYFVKIPFSAGLRGSIEVELKTLNLNKVAPTKYKTE